MAIDHLSTLPDDLLLTILSLLPTNMAARTSILSRRFHHLWKISPSLELIYQSLPYPEKDNFISMAMHALLDRNPFYSLLSLHLEVCLYHLEPSFLSSLFVKAHSLDLRHLTVKVFSLSRYRISPLFDVVFTINSLRSLSFVNCYNDFNMCVEFNFPSEITLTYLTSLSLRSVKIIDMTKFNQHLSKLCSLEDLNLQLYNTPVLRLSSQTIKKLQLVISSIHKTKIDSLSLNLPSLESIYLEIRDGLQSPCQVHVELPLLRKAVINLLWLHKGDVDVVAELLNSISHVKELTMHLKESEDEWHPISFLLKSKKDVPDFLNLEHLELTLCFHEHNLEALAMMLQNCPPLRSLKLVHEIPELTGRAHGRKGKDWRSGLPCNADHNYQCAYFENLYLEENCKEVIKLLKNVSLRDLNA
ncbi:FBD-associated F-box protein At5g60610-like [Carex rostrata]